MTICKIAADYGFEAAHQLNGLPEGHKCKRLHGHNYRVEVSVSGELDARGFVMDYAELDAVVQPLINSLDHRFLNDIPGLENPTSEVLALWLKQRITAALGWTSDADLTIRIYETPRYWVEV
jgi:6-pyruvoyltetrahydropterin/6-carboxytetrahydropterin synthase